MKLSAHFSLAELTVSQEAARRGIDNTPGPDVLKALEWNAANMEAVRSLLNAPVLISSGYRCPALNRAIGSASETPSASAMLGSSAARSSRRFIALLRPA